MKLSRKDFLRSTLGIAGGVAAAGACGSGGDGETTSGFAAAGPTTATTGQGGMDGTGGNDVSSCTADVALVEAHTHMLMVPAADVEAGVQKVYHTSVTGNHSHMVTVTPADFTLLADGQTITIESSVGSVPAHSHMVTATCL